MRMRRVLRPRVLVSAACAFSLMRCLTGRLSGNGVLSVLGM